MPIKYEYSRLGGQIVHIDNVLSSDRQGEYICIGCGNPLTPALGNIRQHYFRHKVVTNCSLETYLHRLAKEKFYETYKHCLENGNPFEISFPVTYKCNFHKELPPIACKEKQQETFDLTKYFPLISMETKHGDFIPDILLQDVKGRVIYVEIKVTHGCTQEKIDSGNRIIEIEVLSEEDISQFSTLKLIRRIDFTRSCPVVHFYNFAQEKIGDYCQGRCNPMVAVFLIFAGGRTYLKSIKISEVNSYIETIEKEGLIASVISKWSRDCGLWFADSTYRRLTAWHFHHCGMEIKNCYLCRYHAEAEGFPETKEKDSSDAFCKFLKKSVPSNFATECKYFRPDKDAYMDYLADTFS